jgi:hypothetical protein
VFLKRQVASSRKEILRRGAMENRRQTNKKMKEKKAKRDYVVEISTSPPQLGEIPSLSLTERTKKGEQL